MKYLRRYISWTMFKTLYPNTKIYDRKKLKEHCELI
jgi:hypothetical protein